jgi:PDZ domain-containing protein
MEVRRQPVSRDTRRLIVIIIAAVALLWVLAEIRFPNRRTTPNPVQPVLAQLTPPPALDDIVASMTELAPQVEPLLVAVAANGTVRPGLRLRGNLAVMLTDDPWPPAHWYESSSFEMVARDPASRLAVVRLPDEAAVELVTWTPRRPDSPRFLVSADISGSAPTLRPVFVGSLQETSTPLWPGSVWVPPPDAGFQPGTFVFTTDGVLAGLVVPLQRGVAIVPGDSLIAAADQLLARENQPPGSISIATQPLTAALASALGASIGVVVTWVDPNGPAAGSVMIADVIESIDKQPITAPDEWEARVSRLSAGDVVNVTVRRSGELREAAITAVALQETTRDRPLGLTLRLVIGAGSLIVAVSSGSAAANAGLQVGDLITRVGQLDAPTPGQIARSYESLAVDRPLVAAVTRGETHRVLILGKR